jgi:acyl-CoA thioester hydrolase
VTTQHIHRVRVRYAESDQMGVAHHSAYVPWCEEARIEWLRARGQSYRDLELSGILMPVIDLRITYQRSLRFDDEAVLTTTAEAVGPSRLVFRTQVNHGETLCARAEVTVACVNREGRPVRLPHALRPGTVVTAGG